MLRWGLAAAGVAAVLAGAVVQPVRGTAGLAETLAACRSLLPGPGMRVSFAYRFADGTGRTQPGLPGTFMVIPADLLGPADVPMDEDWWTPDGFGGPGMPAGAGVPGDGGAVGFVLPVGDGCAVDSTALTAGAAAALADLIAAGAAPSQAPVVVRFERPVRLAGVAPAPALTAAEDIHHCAADDAGVTSDAVELSATFDDLSHARYDATFQLSAGDGEPLSTITIRESAVGSPASVYPDPLGVDGTYRWRVRGTADPGSALPWSDWFTFTVDC